MHITNIDFKRRLTEREGEREGERGRQREGDRERETERGRQREERGREGEREREMIGHRHLKSSWETFLVLTWPTEYGNNFQNNLFENKHVMFLKSQC